MTVDAEKWHVRYLRIAKEVASFSKDPSTKVGCVLVRDRRIISTGFNGFPRGISDDLNRLIDRDQKYLYTVHAEANSIVTAALHGVSTEGCTAYVTFSPCCQCAAQLINAGIKSVFVAASGEIPERWLQNFIAATSLLQEAGVAYHILDAS